jgi:hypothetical protein
MFDSSSAEKQVASAGFNLLDVGSKWAADRLPKGTRGLFWVGDYDNSSCSWQMSDSELRSEVRGAIGDRKVAGYFFSDEPDPFACPNAPRQHRDRSNLIHSLDRKKFTVIDVDANSGRASLRQIPLWRGAAEYIALDPYPCYPGKACNYAWISAIIRAANRAHIRYWGVAQAFSDSDWRWPTPAEERHMLRQWAASKQSGFMTFAWSWAGNSLASRPGLVRALSDFNHGRLGRSTRPAVAPRRHRPRHKHPPRRRHPAPRGRHAPVIAAAGDICGSRTDCAPDGTLAQYDDYYAPNWGRFKGKTRPVPGNHDYHTNDAPGYFRYFGPRAKGAYYSYDLGTWHLIALDGEIGLDSGSPQERWLRADLAAHKRRCTLAYWHEPRFSSGSEHGSDSDFAPFWRDLYAAHADIVLNGHEHNYERFAPQNPSGTADSRGIREFVVGTGGSSHYPFGTPLRTSQVRNNTTFGVLKLTLGRGSYRWEFVPVRGSSFHDSGSGECR